MSEKGENMMESCPHIKTVQFADVPNIRYVLCIACLRMTREECLHDGGTGTGGTWTWRGGNIWLEHPLLAEKDAKIKALEGALGDLIDLQLPPDTDAWSLAVEKAERLLTSGERPPATGEG